MALVLLRYIRFSLIGVILIWIDFAEAVPVVPQFRTGTSQTTSKSEQVLNETVTSHQYRQDTLIQRQDIISNLKQDISTLLLRLRMNKQSEG